MTPKVSLMTHLVSMLLIGDYMLVLKRQVGESIIIDDRIEIKILRDLDSDGIRIGIDAPKYMRIIKKGKQKNKRKINLGTDHHETSQHIKS